MHVYIHQKVEGGLNYLRALVYVQLFMLKVRLNDQAADHTKFNGNMYDHHRPISKLSCFQKNAHFASIKINSVPLVWDT